MLSATGSAAALTILGGIPLNANGQTTATQVSEKDRKKIMVIGAHPDDAETSVGGTICLLTDAGHEVVSVYLTRGQAGIRGKSHEEAAAIREQEARAACAIMNARPVFLSQVDGNSEVNRDRYNEMKELLEREKPDVVITHWPIDGHRDHANCGILVLSAWRQLNRCFELYYFEVMSGVQTQLFHPTDWVDISKVAEQKRAACYCHVSQAMPELYEGYHDPMEVFRGLEARCKRAEAFVHLRRTGNDLL